MCEEFITFMGVSLTCIKDGRHRQHRTDYYDKGISASIFWEKIENGD